MMCCWLWDTNMSCLLQAFVINRKVVYQNILCKWICNIYKFINFTSGVIYYSAPVGERSIAISLSVCLCVCLQACLWNCWTNLPRNFVCRSPVAVAQSSSGGIVIRYVLPVLWMTSRLTLVGRIALCCIAIPGRSLMSMNALLHLLSTNMWHVLVSRGCILMFVLVCFSVTSDICIID